MKASDTIAPTGIGRAEGFRAALFIAARTKGDDRLALLEACGLLPYVPGSPYKQRGCATTTVNYTRPGR